MSRTLTSWTITPPFLSTDREVLPQTKYPLTTWQNALLALMGKRPPTSVYVILEQRQCMSARSRDKCMIVHVCVKTLWVLTVTDGDEEEQDSWDLKLIQHPNNGLSWREGFDSLWLRQEAENNTLTCFIKLVNAVSAPVSPPRSHRLYARHPCSGMRLKEDLINHCLPTIELVDWLAWEEWLSW